MPTRPGKEQEGNLKLALYAAVVSIASVTQAWGQASWRPEKQVEPEEWKEWTAKNDAAAPPLRGAELQKYLAGQYSYTRTVLIDLGLAK